MLAEPKRKTCWTLNPRGKYWSEDKSKFGQKILESMGWKEGLGLGRDENGIKEHIKVSVNIENKGLGYTPSADSVWIEKNEDYEKLLAQLAVHYNHDSHHTEKVSDLEVVSKKMRNRVHYHKLIKAKNLSQCSEKDLISIFPKKKANPSDQSSKDNSKTLHTNDCLNTSDAFKTVESSLNMNDYFTSKMNKLKLKMNAMKVDSIDTNQEVVNQKETSDEVISDVRNCVSEKDTMNGKHNVMTETNDNLNNSETDSNLSENNVKKGKRKRKLMEENVNNSLNDGFPIEIDNELKESHDLAVKEKSKRRKKSKKTRNQCEDNSNSNNGNELESDKQLEVNCNQSDETEQTPQLVRSPTKRYYKKAAKNIEKYDIRLPMGYDNQSASVCDSLKNYHKISAAIVSHKALSGTNLMTLKGYGCEPV